VAERGERSEQVEETFRAIQRAYETLSDPDKRREYDSQDVPAEEPLPDSNAIQACGSSVEFYKLAGDVFRRLSRWSKITDDIPVIGDDATPLSQVKAFYKWWLFSYESQRIFKTEDDHDLNEAENRDERRWMERQNEKMQRDLKRDEKARYTEFVTAAQKFDPRLKKVKAEKEAKREEWKKTKEAEEALRKQKEDEDRRLAQEKEEDERETTKKQKEAEKKRAKDARKQLRNFASTMALVDVEKVINGASTAELCLLVDALKGSPAEAIGSHYNPILKRVQDEEAARAAAAEPARKLVPVTPTVTGPWSVEELGQLARATNKFPGGFANRWDAIQAELRHFGIFRSLDDVQKTAVSLKKGVEAKRVVDDEQIKKDAKKVRCLVVVLFVCVNLS
jgi:DnaJ homolog subfamily C member 2